jgi:hypothetical protein
MPRARRRRGPRRKLPEELLRACLELYGKPGSDEEAAASALLWAALDSEAPKTVKSSGMAERNRVNDGIDAMLQEVAKTEEARSFIDFLREEWLKKSLQALRTDLDFFRRLDKAKQGPGRGKEALHYAILAYAQLYEDPSVDPDKITKLQVQKLAQHRWVFQQLTKDRKITASYSDDLSPEQERLLANAIEWLPQTRWQDIWKHPAFGTLKDAGGGRKRNIVD